MNFFGHATVALADSDDPHLLLGAMLPDLAGMAGARFAAVADPRIERGVDHHHETDRRFHALPAFTGLCADALERLVEQGVSRASARAVGHVGSEMLLDGLLSHDDDARSAYEGAMENAIVERLERRIEWRRGDGDELHRLMVRLAAAPIPDGYREPRFVAERLDRILAPRPRLAMRPGDMDAVVAWLERAQGRLETVHADMLQTLRSPAPA